MNGRLIQITCQASFRAMTCDTSALLLLLMGSLQAEHRNYQSTVSPWTIVNICFFCVLFLILSLEELLLLLRIPNAINIFGVINVNSCFYHCSLSLRWIWWTFATDFLNVWFSFIFLFVDLFCFFIFQWFRSTNILFTISEANLRRNHLVWKNAHESNVRICDECQAKMCAKAIEKALTLSSSLPLRVWNKFKPNCYFMNGNYRSQCCNSQSHRLMFVRLFWSLSRWFCLLKYSLFFGFNELIKWYEFHTKIKFTITFCVGRWAVAKFTTFWRIGKCSHTTKIESDVFLNCSNTF